MYAAWLFFGDHFRDVYFPETENWTYDIIINQGESGWPNDALFQVRALGGSVSISQPRSSQSLSYEQSRDEQRLALNKPVALRVQGRANQTLTVMLKQLQRENLQFRKYRLGSAPVTIGRDNRSVVFDSDMTIGSGPHGYITPKGAMTEYTDQSSNGTYLNGRKINNSTVRLQFGDTLTFPSGLKIIFLTDIVAISAAATLQHVRLEGISAQRVPPAPAHSGDLPSLYTQYHRAPRMLVQPETGAFEVEPPIAKQNDGMGPLWQQVGPSMTMVLPMLFGTLLAGRGGMASAGLIMIGTSSALATMWGLINRRYRKRQAEELESQRISMYQQYIAEQEGLLKAANAREYSRLMTTYPNIGECVTLPLDGTNRLWNRMPTHADFLSVRVGTGSAKLPLEITTQTEKLSLINDPLRNEPDRLKTTYSTVNDAPITISLRREAVVGILGDNMQASLLAQGLLMQIAALHSYHDVRIAVLTSEADASQWSWTRWLPHIFANEDREMRMVGSKPGTIHEIADHLNDVLTMRRNAESPSQDEEDDTALPLPHYVIFCTDSRLLENEPFMRQLLTNRAGMTLVMLATSMEMLPKESHVLLNASVKPGQIHTSDGDTSQVDFEYPNRNLLNTFSHRIAPLRVHDAAENAAIPTLVSFLDIYGVQRTEDLDVWRFWTENHTYEGLRSIIGYTAGSQPFVLDISDKYHGPHGLIAGTTGSGKSVMLETYILSLALNYSPRQIQFILIDYKGGGMADSFRELPHVVGIIDNLQGERVISRALASLNGEIHRRELIFREHDVNNINDYTRQFDNDPTVPNLPHLIIIVDEFAELKSEQPGFMRELVSASRVGRSLGVHLILATQKPSNSVSDEIWANSRFHLCLRVQTRSDSMEMLKRPDAAYIKGMGRCFIQIGNDESFDQVQTSYSGLAYDPNAVRQEDLPHLLGDNGQPIKVPRRRAAGDENKKKTTQMDAVLARIDTVAREHKLTHSRMMWLPEMPAYVYFNHLQFFNDNRVRDGRWSNKPEGIQFLAGLADDVAHQSYIPLVVNLAEIRNLMIVGLAGTGKTTAIQSIAYSLANQYDPAHLNMYVLSLTSRTLDTLSGLPHVGDVVFEDEVTEIRRFLNILTREEEHRGELFAEAATDSFLEFNRSRELKGEPVAPAIVVFVDRFEQLKAMFDNDDAMMAKIFTLIREGSSRGIYFIVTALAKNEIPFKLHTFFSGIALQLNERSDYSDVIGMRVPIETPPIARNSGRGMAVMNQNIYEIQFGLAGYAPQPPKTKDFAGLASAAKYTINTPLPAIESLPDVERASQLNAFARELSEMWTGALPVRIPRIPQDPTWDIFTREEKYLEMQATPFTLPLGYDLNEGEPAPLNLEENFSLFITGPKRSGRTNLLMFLARTMQARGAEVHVIGDDGDWGAFSAETGIPVHSTQQDIISYLHAFQESVLRDERKPKKDAARTKGKAALHQLALELTPYTIIIDNAQRFNTDFTDPALAPENTFMRTVLAQLFAKADHYNIQLFASAPFTAQAFFLQDPLKSLIAQGRGISMGGKVADCNPLGIAGMMPASARSKALPLGQGFLIHEGKLRQLVIPLAEAKD